MLLRWIRTVSSLLDLFVFSLNLLAFYHKCRFPIGYTTGLSSLFQNELELQLTALWHVHFTYYGMRPWKGLEKRFFTLIYFTFSGKAEHQWVRNWWPANTCWLLHHQTCSHPYARRLHGKSYTVSLTAVNDLHTSQTLQCKLCSKVIKCIITCMFLVYSDQMLHVNAYIPSTFFQAPKLPEKSLWWLHPWQRVLFKGPSSRLLQ